MFKIQTKQQKQQMQQKQQTQLITSTNAYASAFLPGLLTC